MLLYHMQYLIHVFMIHVGYNRSICHIHLSSFLLPRFEVVCEDEEESVVVGMSPAECHNHILHTINSTLNMDLLTIRLVLYH